MNQQIFQTFTACVDQTGQIVRCEWNAQQVVGVTLERFQEAEKMVTDAMAKADEYKQQLIDHGILKPEMTPEQQQIAELKESIGTLTSQVSALMTVVQNQQAQQQTKEGNA